MKRFFALVLALALLAGCGLFGPSYDLDGTWRTEDEVLHISGSHAEITGCYALDGQRLAGVKQAGTVEVHRDGSFTIDLGGWIREGTVCEDGSLLVDGVPFYP